MEAQRGRESVKFFVSDGMLYCRGERVGQRNSRAKRWIVIQRYESQSRGNFWGNPLAGRMRTLVVLLWQGLRVTQGDTPVSLRSFRSVIGAGSVTMTMPEVFVLRTLRTRT